MSFWNWFKSPEENMWKALYLNQTLALGDRAVALNITGTEVWKLPPCTNLVSPPQSPNDIWIMTSDAVGANSLTVEPPSGGVIYLNGQSQGVDTPINLPEGSFAVAVAISDNAYAVNVK